MTPTPPRAAHPMTPTDAAVAADVAAEAGRLLLTVREQVGFAAPSQLGAAGDRRANALILSLLRAARPDDAVLSEEADDDLRRLRRDRVWIVDPLDGTREYSTPGRPDWAVHVALWQRGKEITDAAVALPALGEVFRSDTAAAATVAAGAGATRPVRVAVSASRAPSIVYAMSRHIELELVAIGSAGAKAMAVVRGDVDAYVHAGGQWEWDSAAPAGVVLAAGLHASRLDGSPLRYNRTHPYLPDFVMCRPEVAAGLLDAVRRAVS